jgi:hypothetical protein
MDKWNTDNPKNPRTFYIAKASAPMQQVQIKDDATRIQQLQASLTAVQNLQGIKPGDAGTSPPSGPPSGPPPGGFHPWGGGGFVPAPQGRFGPPPGIGQPPPNFAANPNAALNANANSDVLNDRLTNESRGEDWEMKVELVVVVDPPPAAPAAPAAPTTP